MAIFMVAAEDGSNATSTKQIEDWSELTTCSTDGGEINSHRDCNCKLKIASITCWDSLSYNPTWATFLFEYSGIRRRRILGLYMTSVNTNGVRGRKIGINWVLDRGLDMLYCCVNLVLVILQLCCYNWGGIFCLCEWLSAAANPYLRRRPRFLVMIVNPSPRQYSASWNPVFCVTVSSAIR